MSGQLHAPAALPPEKSPRYPFYRRLGGPQSKSGRYGEVNIFFTLTGLELPPPPLRPARSQWLYRLSYPGSTFSFKIDFNIILQCTPRPPACSLTFRLSIEMCNQLPSSLCLLHVPLTQKIVIAYDMNIKNIISDCAV
jgi:hypothetical protein